MVSNRESSSIMTKLHTIQYLRAIAAMLVLASHALLYPVAEQTLAIGRLGWLGVILFFVVSGFIMVTVTGEGRFDARQFMRRRILRVVPLYWGVTIFAALLTLLVPTLFKTTAFDLVQVVLSLLFIPFYNPATHGLHPFYKLGWTLNYEMFFYASFALLALLTARLRVMALTAVFSALALAGMIFHPHDAVPAFYTSFMPLAFVAGAWLGLGYVEKRLGSLGNIAAWSLLVMSVFGLLEGFLIDRGIVEDQAAFVGLLAFAVGIVWLLVAYEPQLPRLARLERLGDASYSIYLAHMFSVAGIAGVVLKLAGTSHPAIIATAILIAIMGGVFLGWLIYDRVEKPLNRRLRRFS
jgi:exopolysaccharide production protein ExoZ